MTGPVVHVEGSDLDLEVEPGEAIIDAAWRLGYYWPTVCWGQAQCTACFVRVMDDGEALAPMGDEERDALEKWLPRAVANAGGEVRLACRAQVLRDVTVQKKGVRPK